MLLTYLQSTNRRLKLIKKTITRMS